MKVDNNKLTNDTIEKEVDEILEDLELRAKLGISKHDRMNIKRRRSLPKMLEILYKADKLQLKDGPSK